MKLSLRAQRELTSKRAPVGQQVHVVGAARAGQLGHHRQGLGVDQADGVGHAVADEHMALVALGAEGVCAFAGGDALDSRGAAPLTS
jgi:hypothetical protein